MADLDRETFERRTGIRAADYDQLKQIPLFAGMADDAAMKLLLDATVRRYPRGTSLFMQGEPADRFFIILEGWVKGFRQAPDGHESVIAVFGPGESFAEAAMFVSGNFPISTEIAADARLLVIPRSGILKQLRDDPDIALKMLASMSRRLRGFVQQVEQLTVKSATQRLASFLEKLVDVDEGSDEFELPLDKMLIAGRLGMQPETLSRALSKLRSIGVATEGHKVIVQDVAALHAINDDDD
ncbi:MAG: Crp/Fnr family transcriptional regulator [Rhodospirillaceae bacterium]|jgi:CRP-like cAMP-binding protein|nr:Crp/Fnr family transcriptional regulator [Rhodospirillaceae bacterium]MBT3780308.1 Crp/Fnr family transcriptional regulator [Rhodospirillaceae bacterium]MBT4746337.1 Crp/Fnr family transcriptional regulator [Rhodospirillaceae bacterium]MBT5129216.1 Crp/Fnr family transcriptional regulator [Rhodospirillaceae bacterium]MBT6258973.1 Crp/Fnr family transcriptional regulator [Rhodospirillaceae bacterium]